VDYHWDVPLPREVLVRPWQGGVAQQGHVVIAATSSDLPPRRQGHAFAHSAGSIQIDATTSARTTASSLRVDFPKAPWQFPSAGATSSATSAGTTSAAVTFPHNSPAGAYLSFGLGVSRQDGRIIARSNHAEEGRLLVLRGDVYRLSEQCADAHLHALQAYCCLPGLCL